MGINTVAFCDCLFTNHITLRIDLFIHLRSLITRANFVVPDIASVPSLHFEVDANVEEQEKQQQKNADVGPQGKGEEKFVMEVAIFPVNGRNGGREYVPYEADDDVPNPNEDAEESCTKSG